MARGKKSAVRTIDFESRQSFFAQIVRAVEEAVADGRFAPESDFPSIPEMARLQGVSPKPVQQAYEYLVEHGILVSRSGRGTRVHENAAANLKRLRTSKAEPRAVPTGQTAAACIGMLVPTVESSLHSAITRMIETQLHGLGRHMILGNYEEKAARLKAYVRSLVDRGDCERIVLSPFRTDFSRPCMDLLKTTEDRLLLLANRMPELDCPCLLLDNERGGAAGARHLLKKGHRNVLFISGPAGNACAEERERGASKTFTKTKSAKLVVARGDFLPDRACRQTIQRFRRGRPFSGIYCVNSLTCVGVLRELHALRVRVPEDVSVLTFDDMEYPTSTPMTVIAQPLERMAGTVVSLIKSRTKRQPAEVRFAPELIERGSVADLRS